jgi:uncharacterized membrane protein YbhN (UPF0104 family)
MGIRARKIYNTVLLMLTIVLIVGVVLYVKNNPTFFQELKNLHIGYLFLLIITHALGLGLLGLTHQLPLRKHNIDISAKEWYGLSVVAEMFNMILPANGGTGIRMMYLKDKKKLPIRQFLSMNFAMIVTGFTMLGIIGSIYFQYIFVRNDSVFNLLQSLFTSLALSGIFLLLFSEILGKVFKIRRKYSPKLYLFDTRLTVTVTFYWFVFFVLYPLKIYLSFLAINQHIGFNESFEISLILLAAYFFQVIPGNLGIKEIITAYVSSHYGIKFETALLASLIDRGALLIFTLPVGIYFYWELFLDAAMPKVVVTFFRPEQSEQTSP